MRGITPTSNYLKRKISNFVDFEKDDNNPLLPQKKLKFELNEKTLNKDVAQFLNEHKSSIRIIKQQCTAGIGGRIPILKECEDLIVFNQNNKRDQIEKNISEYIKTLKDIRTKAQVIALQLGADFIILEEQVNKIHAFITKTQKPENIQSFDLLLEVERIEQRIPRTNVNAPLPNAITLGLRTATDDINLFMTNLSGPQATHGLLAGAGAALIDIMGSAVANGSPEVQQVEDKINKLSLLQLVRSYLTSNPTLPSELEPRINTILQKRRSSNIFKASNSYSLKKQLKHEAISHNQITVANPEDFSTILIEFQTTLARFANSGKNSLEILRSLGKVIERIGGIDNKQLIDKINKCLQNNYNNLYDYLWQTLNNPTFRHCQQRSGINLRRVYYTPLEALQRLLKSNNPEIRQSLDNTLSKLINRLSEIKTLTEELDTSSKYQKVYNYLFNLLENVDKNNVIETMHKVVLVINFQPNLTNNEKNKLYNELMRLRLDTNHGNLFRVANSQRQEASFKKAMVDFLRYGSHNLSTAMTIVGDSSKLYANLLRWETFHGINIGTRSSAYYSYIDHSHTLNSVIQLHEFASNWFSSQALLNNVPTNQQNSYTPSGSSNYDYYQLISLNKLNGKILPNFYHQLLRKEAEDANNKLDPREEIIEFSRLAAKYDSNFKRALNKNSPDQYYSQDCSPSEFEHIAYLALHNAQNPLIGLAYLAGFAAQDSKPDQSWAKMIILVNLLNSVNDSRSILHGKFTPSVAKTFITEMLVSTLVAGIYGATYALLPPAAIPCLVATNWLRIGASDSRTIDQLLRKISNPNRQIAANSLVAFFTKSPIRMEQAKIDSKNLENQAEQKFIQALAKRKLINYLPFKTKAAKPTIDQKNAEEITKLTDKLQKNAADILTKLQLKNNPNSFTSINIDNIVETLHLTKNTTQEQLLRKLLLLSYIIHQAKWKPEVKIQLLAYLLYGIRFGIIASSLRQSSRSFTEAFSDKKNLINTITTLAPYAGSNFISAPLTSTLAGLSIDAIGSFTTNLMSANATKEFTQGYAVIMKSYKQQLLHYARGVSLHQDSPLTKLAYDALGTHRSRWGLGSTESQKRFQLLLKPKLPALNQIKKTPPKQRSYSW